MCTGTWPQQYLGFKEQINSLEKWAAAWQNQHNDLGAQQRLRSAWASAQSDQSFRCVLNG